MSAVFGGTTGVANVTFNGDITKFGSLSTNLTPIDGQQYTSTIQQNMGRVDRIVIDKNGKIKALTGTPGVDNLSPPIEPADSLTINLLFVPPYPSVPQQKDSNYINVIDKGIGSQKFTVQRATNHTVAIPVISDNQIKVYQPSAYTMKDVAALERRISTLEHYVSLSQLEQGVNNLAIPSTVNGNINRFKYGFFADSFQTTTYSDLQHPEYKATIIANQVVAKQTLNNIEFRFNSANAQTAAGVSGLFLTLPYTQVVLVQQSFATNGAITTTTTTVTTTANTSTPPSPPITYNGQLSCSPTSFTLISKVDTTDVRSVDSNNGGNKYDGIGSTIVYGGGTTSGINSKMNQA
jgi:hypothetical protein